MRDIDDQVNAPKLERAPSGISGLDAILGGGFFRGGVYLIRAEPGAGKTILANQICFQHVGQGGRALFLTLLTESHSRLLSQLKDLTFFDPKHVGSTLSYVSGYQTLEKDRLKGLLVLLRKVVRDHKATFLVIDGMVATGAMAESGIETKKFVHELQVFVELIGCTTLLLTGEAAAHEQYALRTMVDGLLELHDDADGMGTTRTILVPKFRGGAVLRGRHPFEITDAGITIHPRTESRHGRAIERTDPTREPLATFGIQWLDMMVGGGLRSGSVTMLLGTPGSGKTLLGLSSLVAGAKEKQLGLYYGFFETPNDLCRKADAIGIGLGENMKTGLVDLMWRPPLNVIADALAEEILVAIRKRGIRRLFIDGLGGFKESLIDAERSRRFFGALCNELRSLGVVTIFSAETRTLSEIESPGDGFTAMLDNVIFLRHVELRAQLHKLISVVKMREGPGDPSLHEFSIDARGFVVSSTSESAEAILDELFRYRVAADDVHTRPTKTKVRRR
jgi:circadian clock protein KaiC